MGLGLLPLLPLSVRKVMACQWNSLESSHHDDDDDDDDDDAPPS